MQGYDHFFPLTIHKENLTTIEGVNFTPRELDIISCIINVRGARKISALLFISPNTVLAHTRNIMLKLGCNSRECVIDFIEHSQTLAQIKQHYAHLVIHGRFEKYLREIGKENAKDKKQVRLFFYEGNKVHQKTLCIHLGKHLKQVSINVKGKKAKEAKSLLIFLKAVDQEKIPKEWGSLDSIILAEHQNYYFVFFAILKKILPPSNVIKHLQGFIQESKGLMNTENEVTRSPKNKKILEVIKTNAFHKKIQVLKNKKWYLFFVLYSTLPWFFTLPVFKGHQEIQQLQNRAAPFQTIIFVGLEGIDKTILSPQYAHQEKPKAILKIKAEPHTVIIKILIDIEARNGDLGSGGGTWGSKKFRNPKKSQ